MGKELKKENKLNGRLEYHVTSNGLDLPIQRLKQDEIGRIREKWPEDDQLVGNCLRHTQMRETPSKTPNKT